MSDRITRDGNSVSLQDAADDSDDGMWTEFENCAQAVTKLFRNSNWRTLQSAAGSTTQLYKSGLECKKRSFDKGFILGRQALAKEIAGICRYKNKIDVGDVITLLSRYDLLPADSTSSPRRHRHGHSVTNAALTPADGGAVHLFQQALCPPSSSPGRTPELTNFLQHQVYRHRKRPHSPVSNSNAAVGNYDASHSPTYVTKRFKRL